MKKPDRLTIRNFAQIADADLVFGDLTVLVGAQGTGKSLALQWLKAAMDGKQVVNALRAAGQYNGKSDVLVDLIFGAGMGAAWKSDETAIAFNGRKVAPRTLALVGDGTESVFYVPAHRSMLLADGWAAPFQRLTSDTPVVAFSARTSSTVSAPEETERCSRCTAC